MEKDCIKCGEKFETKTSTKICALCKESLNCRVDGCQNKARHYIIELCHKHYMLMFRKKDEEGYERKICMMCGQSYKPNCPTQIFCNEECSHKRRLEKNRQRRRKPKVQKICVMCDTKFQTSRNFQECCSHKCSDSLGKKTKREYYYNVIKPERGHLDKGKSWPQQHLFDIISNKFSYLTWIYDDRSTIRNPNTNHTLELDIWCPDRKLAIEYDGEHHFSSKVFGKDVFDKVQILDRLKDKLCKEKGIKLLRVSNKDNWDDEKWIIKKVEELINGNSKNS